MMGLDFSRLDRYRHLCGRLPTCGETGPAIERMLRMLVWRKRNPERCEARERWAWDAFEFDCVTWKWPR